MKEDETIIEVTDLRSAQRLLAELVGRGTRRFYIVSELRNRAFELDNPRIKTIALLAARACTCDPDSLARQEAAKTIGELGSRRDLYAIRILLKDGDWMVRDDATIALGLIGNRRDRQILWKILENDPNWIVRGSAALAIAENAEDDDADRLRGLLERFRNHYRTESCIMAALLELDQQDLLERYLEGLYTERHYMLCRILGWLEELWPEKEWLRQKEDVIRGALVKFHDCIHRYRSSQSSEEELLKVMNGESEPLSD